VLHPCHGGQCTVRAVSLVEQWNRLETALDPRWKDARLSLQIADRGARSRAAALLGPAGPGLAGAEIRFTVSRDGTPMGPEAVRRMLRRLDAEGIAGTLELVGSGKAAPEPARTRATLVAEWDAAVSALPPDWSDLECELEVGSSNDLDRAAVLAGPLNPIRTGVRPGFRFRCASRRGYGASAGMVRRCLARLDDAGIGGATRIVRVLCDTHPVGTQGAVFSAGSRPS
jgi:hypothetical protein